MQSFQDEKRTGPDDRASKTDPEKNYGEDATSRLEYDSMQRAAVSAAYEAKSRLSAWIVLRFTRQD